MDKLHVYNCEVCGQLISYERVIIAESRGKVPKYDRTTCRRTAEKRRERASASSATAPASASG